MSKNQNEDYSHFFKTLVDNSLEPVFIINFKRQVKYQNAAAKNLPDDILDHLMTIDLRSYTKANNTKLLIGDYVALICEQDGLVVFSISEKRMADSSTELNKLSELLNKSDNIFTTANIFIQKHLKWRWTAITRFTNNEHLEVLSYFENQAPVANYEYEIVGTPCEAVIANNHFTQFEDVSGAFPNYQPLKDAGIKNYAGLVFRDSDGKAIGHIMAMHDNEDVDFAWAREVIETVTLALSSHFKLREANAQLNDIKLIANSDALTGIGNRFAFDATLERIREISQANRSQEWTIAIVDLDKLKPLNDNRGHKYGDDFICLMAQELTTLGRRSDPAFRIGGDEFAIIFDDDLREKYGVLRVQIEEALARTSHTLQFNVDASVGFSVLSESNRDISQWIQIADGRMYEHKQSKIQIASEA